MFDIGFAELLIIGVVGLLVIGPERLPGTIRTVSAWMSRLRRGFNEIKQEVKQELHNDEVMQQLRETGQQLKTQANQLGQDLNSAGASLKKPLTGETPTDEPPLKPAQPSDKPAE